MNIPLKKIIRQLVELPKFVTKLDQPTPHVQSLEKAIAMPIPLIPLQSSSPSIPS
jgi:hypothetical protein